MTLKRAFVPAAVILMAAAGYSMWLQKTSKSQNDKSSHPKSVHDSRRPRLPESPLLRSITQPSIYWEERIQSVNLLPNHLDAEITLSLFDYLTEKPDDESLQTWYLICNEIIQTLRKRELPTGQYTRRLTALVESAAADPVIRDYATQHLSQWISGIDQDAMETDPILVESAFDAMSHQAEAVENGQLSIVGTTLNALVDALLNGQGVILAKRERLQKIAVDVASIDDGSVATFSRAAALQAAARLDAPELPGLCRNMINNPDTAPDVRLGSVAALGLVGITEDIPLLQSFAPDSPFHYAAAAAIQRLQDKSASR